MSAEYFHALAVNGILLTQISQPDAVARDICTESDTVRYQNAVIAYADSNPQRVFFGIDIML